MTHNKFRDDFELARPYPWLDIPPAKPPASIALDVVNTRQQSAATIVCGTDESGMTAWLVTCTDPASGRIRCGWAYDRRTAEAWAEEWPQATGGTGSG